MDYEINKIAWTVWQLAMIRSPHPDDVQAETIALLVKTIEHVSHRQVKPIEEIFVPKAREIEIPQEERE